MNYEQDKLENIYSELGVTPAHLERVKRRQKLRDLWLRLTGWFRKPVKTVKLNISRRDYDKLLDMRCRDASEEEIKRFLDSCEPPRSQSITLAR